MTKILVDSELLEEAADALAMFNKKLQPQVNGADESCFTIGLKQQVTFGQMVAAAQAHDNLRAALDAPSVPEGWQPISTAPKDGTKLLLCVEGFEASTGCFHPDFNRWTTFPIDGFEEKKEWERWFVENEYKPTLWMRLPTLSTAPKSPTTDDQKDAARYRWLRQYPIGIRPWDYYKLYTDELDSKIDAAIAAQKGEKE